jgi:hypothetical protein
LRPTPSNPGGPTGLLLSLGLHHGPVCTNHIIPGIALLTISGLTQNAVQFLKDMDDYFHCKSVGDSLKLSRVTKAITDKSVKIWLMATKA